MLEEYLTITIVVLIKLYALDFSNWFEVLSSVLAIVLGVLVIFAPFWIWHFLYKHHVRMKEKKFVVKYGSLVDGLTHRKKTALLYGVIFILRRIFMALFIIVIPSLNWLQTQLMVLLCSFVIISIGWIQPFKMKILNRLELLNEVLVLISFYYMIIYSEFVPDAKARYKVGWSNACLVAAMVLVNISYAASIQANQYKHMIKIKVFRFKSLLNKLKRNMVPKK